MLPIEIKDLEPEALRTLSKYLQRLSNELRAHADHTESTRKDATTQKAKISQAKEQFYSAGAMVLSYVDAGTPIETAVQMIMAATGYDEEATRFAYSLAMRKKREKRDIVIEWLKQRGWTDAEIGQVVDLHEKSVTRLRSTRTHD